MKFYGEPNLTVIEFRSKKALCKFNDKGEFITEDEKLINKLRQHFKYEETPKKRVKK
jgi:hypothetical protein